MIFYFSGTGNSLYAAKKLLVDGGEKLVSIPEEMNKNNNEFKYILHENEKAGFVYPVYAWQPPSMVLDFIQKMNLAGYCDNYIYSVCTCGDEEGYTTDILKKALSRKGLELNSGFTVCMPNNYIISFNLDPEEVRNKKLARANEFLTFIHSVIDKRQDGVFEIRKGKLAFAKSFIVNPLFRKFAMNTKKFYATDNCTKCGLCAKVCSANNINVYDKPVWGPVCTHCLACIHRCPENAVQYGKSTLKKSRYIHPDCTFEDKLDKLPN